ncbi:MAG: orotidine-5'-phosphate decarboxylase [Treponema sp.]|uniref:orotidine-5'-phosphate decarboxylase n=1 Tax=Treponema sp. TaxID=166 RepID=UPI00298E0106|nr:orotidine-5'-phosphate decarboxylase [Treponema sp.]MCQ2600612.1 orotidine-5'-phosphate decarboxylase [Treponema sp.]
MKHAMQKLQEDAKKFGPLCVGLDTDPSYIPENIIKNYSSAAEAVLAYNLALIERIKKDQSACCFKIQVAYYEAMGLKGMEVYAKTVKAVRDAGFVAISDIKRGDIAATAGAYARAHFTGDFETDIITINPYMGFDTLKPFTEYTAAEKGSKAMFVLLRTSNPGMVDIEQQELKDGGRVLDRVGNELNNILQESRKEYADETCSPVGAVVGCTEESDARALRDAYPEIFFLIPGYGAQGGAAKICGILLEKCGGTVNSSRGILCAWKKDASLEEKRNAGTLTMDDLINASAKAAIDSKTELMSF